LRSGHSCRTGIVVADERVCDALDLFDLFASDPLEVADVEPGGVDSFLCARLSNVIAEHLASRVADQVGRGVVRAEPVTAVAVDLPADELSLPGVGIGAMEHDAVALLYVDHVDGRLAGGELAPVGRLAAALGIEHRLV